jgi:hypothetical protein
MQCFESGLFHRIHLNAQKVCLFIVVLLQLAVVFIVLAFCDTLVMLTSVGEIYN